MHPDEGYGGPKMIPGYAGAYKNSKAKTIGLKSNGNPKSSYGPEKSRPGQRKAEELRKTKPLRKKNA